MWTAQIKDDKLYDSCFPREKFIIFFSNFSFNKKAKHFLVLHLHVSDDIPYKMVRLNFRKRGLDHLK